MSDDYEEAGELDEGAAGLDEAEVNSEEDDEDALEDNKENSDDEDASSEEEEEAEAQPDNDCVYRHMRAKKALKEEPIIVEELYDEQIVKATMGGYVIIDDPDLLITDQVMTIYEFERIWGLRTRQLGRGAQARVQSTAKKLAPREIAALEMRKGLAPYIILRPIVGHKVPTAERWYFRDLKIPDRYWPEKPLPMKAEKVEKMEKATKPTRKGAKNSSSKD
jgi:DNA-directed RNA polymerase subunit K/omega